LTSRAFLERKIMFNFEDPKNDELPEDNEPKDDEFDDEFGEPDDEIADDDEVTDETDTTLS
jgi:tRNA U34 5-methylaminomethyl-2-thiouridine-forming methyltransferase MnmC